MAGSLNRDASEPSTEPPPLTTYEKTNDGAGPSAMESTMNTLSDPPELSPLEQEVLEEYEVLAENMKKVYCLPALPPIPLPLAFRNSQRRAPPFPTFGRPRPRCAEDKDVN